MKLDNQTLTRRSLLEGLGVAAGALGTVTGLTAMNSEPRNIELIVCPNGETGPKNLRNSEGSVIELQDGRLFLVTSSYSTGSADLDVCDIKGKLSADGGRTWTPPFVVQANDARINVMSASLFRLGTFGSGYAKKQGALGFTYVKHETKYTDGIYFRLSRDDGQSWSAEIRINETPTWADLTMRNDTPIVHSSGRIIVPVQASFGDIWGGFMYFSDDEGNTWYRSEEQVLVRERVPFEGYPHPGGIPLFFADCEEPAIVELKDGRVMLFGRTMLGRIYRAFSEDRGNTWTDAEPTDLASSYSPCTLKRIPSTGDLLCIWNQVSAEEIRAGWVRCRMSCAISKDDGKTWEHFKNLESLNDVVRIEPPPLGSLVDATGEARIIKSRGVIWKATKTPLDPKLYPKKGYQHVDYPSCAFTNDNYVVITYGVYAGQGAGLTNGNKLVIHPVRWLYQ